MKSNYKLVLWLSLCFMIIFSQSAFSQITSKGKDFWVGFMPNANETTPFTKLFITSENNASGTVTIPGLAWSVNFNVVANTTTFVEIPIDKSTNISNEAITKQGIHITSDNEVNVFAMNYELHTVDGTLVLPTNALGVNYFAMSYQPTASDRYSEFLIVAVEDNTSIRIIPSQTTKGGKTQFTPFEITLNKGEEYLVQSSNDLTGSNISSIGNKKPFALFSGSVCGNVPVNVSYCNHLFEQMYPTTTWRRNYLAIPYLTRTADTYKVLALKNGTTVTIDGVAKATLNSGQSYETLISSPSMISANLPISVAQFSNGGSFDGATGDPFMIMLSPIEQTRTELTFESFAYTTITENFLNIAATTTCTSNILLDGAPVTNWNTFPTNPNYSYAQVTLAAQGTHRIVSTNEDCGFIGYVYGYGTDDSYGYSAGVSLDTLSVSFTAYTNCLGKQTEFFVKSQPYTILTYNWAFGDGGISKLANPKYKYTKAGQYTVKLIVQYDDNSLDTVSQVITVSGIKADFTVSGGGCVRDIQVDNSSVGLYDSFLGCNWEFGDGSVAKGISAKHTYLKAGNYTVMIVAESGNHCFDTLRKIVKIFDPPTPKIIALGPTTFCTCDSVILDAGNLGYISYKWSSGETTQKITVHTSGNFTVAVIDTNKCTGTSPALGTTAISPATEISFVEPKIIAEPGEYFKYNIILTADANINICKIKNYTAVVSFKKTIIVPSGTTPTGTMDNYRRSFTINGTWNGKDSIIATLDFRATLGDSIAGDIKIDSFAWTECDLPSKKGSSIIELKNLCTEGGITRLFKSTNSAIYVSVKPNPVENGASIEFDLKTNDNCEISIYDLLGNKIKDLFKGEVKSGIQTVYFNSSEYNNGTYYLIVKTAENTTQHLIEVQK